MTSNSKKVGVETSVEWKYDIHYLSTEKDLVVFSTIICDKDCIGLLHYIVIVQCKYI